MYFNHIIKKSNQGLKKKIVTSYDLLSFSPMVPALYIISCKTQKQVVE